MSSARPRRARRWPWWCIAATAAASRSRSPAASTRTRSRRTTRPPAGCTASPRLSGPARAVRRIPADPPGRPSMSDANNNTGTVTLHRVLRAPPERVYRAFVDPAAMAKWSPPHGFTGVVHESDVRVGGGYRMSFTNFSTGTSHTFGGRYVELVEGERIRYTDAFEDPGLPG